MEEGYLSKGKRKKLAFIALVALLLAALFILIFNLLGRDSPVVPERPTEKSMSLR